MSNVALEVFLPEILPYVPSCPDITAVIAVRGALIEFCEQSYAWQEDVDPIVLVAGEPEYEIDTPTGAMILDIAHASVGQRHITPKPADELVRLYGVDWRQSVGYPLYYNRIRPDDVLRLIPIPDKAVAASKERLNVRSVLVPLRNVTTCDEVLYQSWVEGIAAGAMQRLFTMVGQSFSNPSAGAYYGRRFRTAVNDAKIATNKSNVRSNTRVSYNPF